jgi:general secretion pathway protein A
MYLRHFALTQDPFSIAPDPQFLILSDRHREALAHLLYGVSGTGGFVLLTGDIGTGKTTVCRCFLEQVPALCNVAIVFNPKLSVLELLQTICEEFQIEMPPASAAPAGLKSHIDALNNYLLNTHALGQNNVLIVDEAQNLKPDVLEQLRLLTNLETSERKLLQIVLIGQPELRTMLERPDLEQLAQRVIARFHLEALSEPETARYIQHRMAIAGHSGPLPFDAKTLSRIYQLTNGVPRRINLLCGRALLGAWANNLAAADPAMVDKAADEVFGPRAKPPVSRLRAYAPVALGGLGILAIVVAMAMQIWPGSARQTQAAEAATAPGTTTALSPGASAALGSKNSANTQDANTALTSSTLAATATQNGNLLASTTMEDASSLLPKLPANINLAWRELGLFWKLPGQGAGGKTPDVADDPCRAAAAQQLQCFTGQELSIPLLRQLGRPGILTLQAAGNPPVFAVLTGLNDQTATLLAGGAVHRVSLSSLGGVWRGAFSTYWRPPPGFGAPLREGKSMPLLSRLASQLATLEGQPASNEKAAPVALDADLKIRIRAFQKGQGLKPDGLPGPLTLMQIDRALGNREPSLQVAAP